MNIKKIAELAGVSPSTVSKIINKKDSSISSKTREKVLEIVRKYNYKPYGFVQGRKTRSFLVGVITKKSNLSALIQESVFHESKRFGYNVIFNTYKDSEDLGRILSSLINNNVDGLVIEKSAFINSEIKETVKSSEIPTKYFSLHGNTDIEIPYADICSEATNELIKKGHTNIGFITNNCSFFNYYLQGYKKSLFDNDIPFKNELVFEIFDEALFTKVASNHVSAFVCSSGNVALSLYEKMVALNYNIPYDFSIVAIDTFHSLDNNYPHISNIKAPFDKYSEFLIQDIIAKTQKSRSPKYFSCPLSINHTKTISIPPNKRNKRIVVVGSINIDQYLNFKKLPSTGNTMVTDNSSIYSGGKATNCAVGCAKLGKRVSIIGGVGNDIDSNLIYSSLKPHDIDFSGVRRYQNKKTGKAYIFVESSGESIVSILSGANYALSPSDILANQGAFENAAYCLLSTEVPLDAINQALKIAHKNNVKTILKPSSCNHLPNEIIKGIDILVPNGKELDDICPINGSIEEKARFFLSKGVKKVIVTLGPKGCMLVTPTDSLKFEAVDFPSIDNTGAADAFMSALASYLLDGYDIISAIKIATYAAAFSITREGVTPSLVDRSTLESYIYQKDSSLLSK